MTAVPPLDQATRTRILLVEDNDINRELLSDYLKFCGWDVLSIDRGAYFSSTLELFQPDLILLDLRLPDIDGFTLLSQVQNSTEYCHIPVIVISACAFQADQKKALNLGARRYLVKPMGLSQLKDAISEELDYLLAPVA